METGVEDNASIFWGSIYDSVSVGGGFFFCFFCYTFLLENHATSQNRDTGEWWEYYSNLIQKKPYVVLSMECEL